MKIKDFNSSKERIIDLVCFWFFVCFCGFGVGFVLSFFNFLITRTVSGTGLKRRDQKKRLNGLQTDFSHDPTAKIICVSP